MTKLLLILVTCFISSMAFAIGGDNTHNQGVRLAGRGFDESLAKQVSQPVPSFELTHWPPPVAPTRYQTNIANGRTLLVTASCPPTPPGSAKPIDDRFALCSGRVQVLENGRVVPQTPACDLDDSATGDVSLLAIRAVWNSQSRLEMSDQAVTFACAPTFPAGVSINTLSDLRERTSTLAGDVKAWRGYPKEQAAQKPLSAWKTTVSKTVDKRAIRIGAAHVTPLTLIDLSNIDTSHNLGVLSKCYFWGFAKDRDVEHLLTYEACVRAARADYCGNGKSQTTPGTTIQIYETPTSPLVLPPPITEDPANCKPAVPVGWDPCFEALWDERRALCISHDRWEEMPPDDCQKTFRFPVELNKDDKGRVITGKGQTTIYCTLSEYEQLVRASRIKNRSGLNTSRGVYSCSNDILCP